MKNSIKILLSLSLAMMASQAQAVPCADITSGVFELGTTTAAGENSAANSVSINCEDHTGNDTYGSGSLLFDGMIFDSLSKFEWNAPDKPNVLDEMVDINLTVTAGGVTGTNGGSEDASTTGTWSFTNIADYDTYVIVLKDGVLIDDVKWSAYLLDSSLFGATGSTWAGDWIFGGDPLKELSHLSVYGRISSTVPEPGIIGLLAIGLLGMVVARRRMKL